MYNCFTSGVRCLQDLLFIFKQEGLRSAGLFSQGQSYHVTVLQNHELGSQKLIPDVEVDAAVICHFFARTVCFKVDELRGFLKSGV